MERSIQLFTRSYKRYRQTTILSLFDRGYLFQQFRGVTIVAQLFYRKIMSVLSLCHKKIFAFFMYIQSASCDIRQKSIAEYNYIKINQPLSFFITQQMIRKKDDSIHKQQSTKRFIRIRTWRFKQYLLKYKITYIYIFVVEQSDSKISHVTS